jgi:hypothetical protein
MGRTERSCRSVFLMPAHPVRLAPSGRRLGRLGTWHTLTDFDFAAQPSQGLGVDGVYPMGGVNWRKENSANDFLPAALVTGLGAVFCPVGNLYAYEQTHNGPWLSVPLAELVTDPSQLRGHVPMRVAIRGYVDGVAPVNSSEIYAGVHFSANSLAYGSVAFSKNVRTCGSAKLKWPGPVGPNYEYVMTNSPVWPAADCTEIWFPNGVGGMSLRAGRGIWAGTWPEFSYLAGWDPDRSYWELTEWPTVGTWREWHLAVGWKSQGNGLTFQGIVQNVRLEAYY